ncbi:MAG: hypothetical protein IH939_12905 [Acidobacteria bacterium]|nr:hypothetical protein [Acidobacteriota bacterium]
MTLGQRVLVAGVLTLVVIAVPAALAQIGPKFYDDDPLPREPETQDASNVQERDNILAYDLIQNLFATPGDTRRIRAQNVNTIDEVPDSNWFTNRILARPLSLEEALRGPVTHPGPAPGPMTVTRAKPAGVAPGFVARDSADVIWHIQFDAPGFDDAASGASMVANRIFHALGYFQMEYHLTEIRFETLEIDPGADTETPSGAIRQLDLDDLAKVFKRAARQANGAYRALASRDVENTLEGFRYYGTRPDDPNDIIPHEHRRELRALKVFGAWLNLVDMKAGNTLDVLVSKGGLQLVRHYLQDVGSTFGTGALGPREWDEGYEYLYEGSATWKRLVSFGLYQRGWQRVPYVESRSIGRFEGTRFDPETWKPRVPTTAILNARADDTFWAARRVMAFSDALIRGLVQAGEYSDPAAAQHLADVLIARRDRIAEAYLPAINPIVDVALDRDGVLTFGNAAVEAGVAAAPGQGYRGEWYLFDNATRASTPIGDPTASATGRMPSPSRLPAAVGAFIRVDLSAVEAPNASWSVPIQTYFRRTAQGWRLVGLERMPADPPD